MEFEKYERPSVAVDLVLFRMRNVENRKKLQIALIKREHREVENGKWSLPGGFVDIDKTLEETICGKITEKIGFSDFSFEQLYVVDNPQRDERWRVISCTFIGVCKFDDTRQYKCSWFDVNFNDNNIIFEDKERNIVVKEENLAFDHKNIVLYAIRKMRNTVFHSNLPYDFINETFTISELKSVFEEILCKHINNFSRTISSSIEETGKILKGKACRPAKLYRKRVENVQI